MMGGVSTIAGLVLEGTRLHVLDAREVGRCCLGLKQTSAMPCRRAHGSGDEEEDVFCKEARGLLGGT